MYYSDFDTVYLILRLTDHLTYMCVGQKCMHQLYRKAISIVTCIEHPLVIIIDFAVQLQMWFLLRQCLLSSSTSATNVTVPLSGSTHLAQLVTMLAGLRRKACSVGLVTSDMPK